MMEAEGVASRSDKQAMQQEVVTFLLQEKYFLTAFELLHELLESGQEGLAVQLQEHFSNIQVFKPDEMLQLQNYSVNELPRLLNEVNNAALREARLAEELQAANQSISELRLALEQQAAEGRAIKAEDKVASSNNFEDTTAPSEKAAKTNTELPTASLAEENRGLQEERERLAINRAVKEYLMQADYKLTAMTFSDEVEHQDLDEGDGPSEVKNALHCYYQAFSSSFNSNNGKEMEFAVQKVAAERDALAGRQVVLLQAIDKAQQLAQQQKQQVEFLEAASRQTVTEIEAHQAKYSALQSEMLAGQAVASADLLKAQSVIDNLREQAKVAEQALQGAEEERKKLRAEAAELRSRAEQLEKELGISLEKVAALENKKHLAEQETAEDVSAVGRIKSLAQAAEGGVDTGAAVHEETNSSEGRMGEVGQELPAAGPGKSAIAIVTAENDRQREYEAVAEDASAVKIIAQSLPKIVPNVLISKREELLPLIMCAIEKHPDSATRDSLTHGLFNLIKKPDEEQRRIIMDACVELASRVGEERTETELLPQCWEQISHKFAERRLLVARSCGQLARYVRSEIRGSLIFSIIQQLTDDPAPVVREAAAFNLAMLLPLISDMDKYSKVEEVVFSLVCDPAGEVVEESLKRLVPCLVTWARAGRHPLSQLLRALLHRLLATIHRCPAASGVEGSPEAHLRVLGERERWNLDVLLRMLVDILPEVRHAAVKTNPLPPNEGLPSSPRASQSGEEIFTQDLLDRYARAGVEWPAFDWLPIDCLPTLLQLACMLQPREEALRSRLCKVLLAIAALFGPLYMQTIVAPMFSSALRHQSPHPFPELPQRIVARIEGLKPESAMGEKLAVMCVLPLLLAGVLGAPGVREGLLAEYLQDLVYSTCLQQGAWSFRDTPDLINAFRFLSAFGEHHATLLSFLWGMVVNPTPAIRVTAAVLFQVLTAFADLKIVGQQILPALITLGSDPNLDVKYSSIEAFGAVAQHYKDETIVEKIRIQMDSFLEDGSHQATVAVLRALTEAVPVTIPSLKDYLLQKTAALAGQPAGIAMVLQRRRERSNALAAALRALDASADMSTTSVRELFIPATQALLRDTEVLDIANKEALEIILRERGGGTSLSKAMGKGFFGDSFLSRNLSGSEGAADTVGIAPPEESKLKRMMRLKYEEMMKARSTKQLTSNAHGTGSR